MTSRDREIVSTLERALARRIGPARFDTWFVGNASFDIGDGKLSIRVANRFYEDWLRRNFRRDIDAACAEVLGDARPIEYRVDESVTPVDVGEIEPDPNGNGAHSTDRCARRAKQSARPARARRGRRFAKLTDLVVGESNRLAMTSAEMVAGQLGALSPLLVYGPTGVGKTHLLEGIWSSVRRSQPQARIVFLTSEQFTSYFLEALRGSGLPNFRRKYRGVDLLVIDDVQFFAGKRATLVELLYTLDTLLEEGNQIVLSADRSPAELQPLGEELVNRLQGGMVCRIEPPGQKTRLEITRRLAQRMNLRVPDEVARFIATRLTSSARQLSGALNRLQATSHALGAPITLPLARQALAELISQSAPSVRLDDVEKAVCDVFGLKPASLQSPAKSKQVNHPRMLAMWLARKYTRAALSEIGDYFGRRSHSTVISARHKVEGWIAGRMVLELNGAPLDVNDVVRRVEENLRIA